MQMKGLISLRFQCHSSTLISLAWDTIPPPVRKTWEEEVDVMKKNATCTQEGMEYFHSKFINDIEEFGKVILEY